MALLRYSLLRALLLVVVGALAWLAGLRGFWLLLVAVFVSGVLSIFVLNRNRDEVSRSLATRMSTIKNRLGEQSSAEDAWDDARRNTQTMVRQRAVGTEQAMDQDRRTKEAPTPGEDPREIDRERTSADALDETRAQHGLVHGQQPDDGLGTSADAPGRDLDQLADAPDVPRLRDES